MSGLLSGVKVLLVVGERGATAASYLETMGADVTRVGEASEAQLKAADIVIGSAPVDFRDGGALARARLDAINPGLVSVSLTAFGVDGPYADFDGPEIVVSAMSGALGVTGYEDRPPVKEAEDACGFHAEMMAAAGAMMALHAREVGHAGQHADISVHEVAAGRMTSGILAWQFDHRLLERTGAALSYGKARVRCVWDLADGSVFHSLMTGRFGAPANAALSAWMDEAGFDNPMQGVDWIKYDRSALDADTRAVWEKAIAAFFGSLTKEQMRVEGRRRGINACVANEPLDVLSDPQLAARGFWAERDGVKAPVRFVRVADSATAHPGESRDPGQASNVGKGSEPPPKAGANLESRTGSRLSPGRAGTGQGALAGVRVLDFSWALVGSITTKLLADHGAEVVKVESASRPCLSRIDVQVAASKRGSFDDKPWFIHMNTGKKSLRINMKHPAAREVIDPLIEWADVVVENFSPGTMKSLGLDYESLSKRRPDLVMVSGSVFGQTGPLAKEWGVDGTGAALSGRLALTGWPDRTPVTPSSVPYGDVVLPPVMAAATAAAVIHRMRTGRGVHVDASMYEVCVQQMAPTILAAQTGAKPVRHGNDDPDAVLQGVYLAGSHMIAIRVADEAGWERLGRLVGGEWGASRDMLAGARRRETEAHILFWLEHHEPWDAMALLQGAGVAAGVVQTAADIVDRDPQLKLRGALVEAVNPVLGTFAHQGTPIHLSRTPATIRTAPGLGEHTDRIAAEIAGMTPERIAELRAAGLFE